MYICKKSFLVLKSEPSSESSTVAQVLPEVQYSYCMCICVGATEICQIQQGHRRSVTLIFSRGEMLLTDGFTVLQLPERPSSVRNPSFYRSHYFSDSLSICVASGRCNLYRTLRLSKPYADHNSTSKAQHYLRLPFCRVFPSTASP